MDVVEWDKTSIKGKGQLVANAFNALECSPRLSRLDIGNSQQMGHEMQFCSCLELAQQMSVAQRAVFNQPCELRLFPKLEFWICKNFNFKLHQILKIEQDEAQRNPEMTSRHKLRNFYPNNRISFLHFLCNLNFIRKEISGLNAFRLLSCFTVEVFAEPRGLTREEEKNSRLNKSLEAKRYLFIG